MRPSPVRQPRGFTLVELLVSVAIMGILMTGLGSALLIATHGLPDPESPAAAIATGADVADQIAEELREAIYITTLAATEVAFTVPDRDGDTVPERIRYRWQGTPGDPLTRWYNDDAPVDLIEEVDAFDLGYDLETVAEEYSGVATEGPEGLLSQFSNFSSTNDKTVDQNHWHGQYFEPALPDDAVCWRVTRVRYVAKRENNNNELCYVRLRPAGNDSLPTETIVDEVGVYESTLAFAWAWKEVTFANAGGLMPSEDMCLVFEQSVSGNSAKVRFNDHSGPGRLYTDHAGSDWEAIDGWTLFHYIYGKVSTPGPPLTATRSYVSGVRITLQVVDDPAARVVTAAQTSNMPEVLSAVWEAGFNVDPRLDHNGDDQADWVVRSGSFGPEFLSAGIWDAQAILDSYPDNDFTDVTTVEVRFRSTDVDATGALFTINADWSGGTCAPLFAQITMDADRTQSLRICDQQDELTKRVLVKCAGLSSDFVTVRLLIDPDLDAVNVQVDGVDHGTFAYNTVTPSGDDRFATIQGSGAAEFDFVAVRISP